jgi:hypothetical protein
VLLFGDRRAFASLRSDLTPQFLNLCLLAFELTLLSLKKLGLLVKQRPDLIDCR